MRDNADRFYFNASGTFFFHTGSCTTGGSGFVYRSLRLVQSDIMILTVGNNGALSIAGIMFCKWWWIEIF